MNDTEVIKAAVGYADGWEMRGDVALPPLFTNMNRPGFSLHNTSKLLLAALAAQLVEQIDAMSEMHSVSTSEESSTVFTPSGYIQKGYNQDNRTMNTLRACVDFMGSDYAK